MTPGTNARRFTPFMPTLEREVEAALGRLLGTRPIRWRDHHGRSSDDPLAVVAEMPGEAGLVLQLGSAGPRARGWFVGKRLTLSYRKHEDEDPMATLAGRSQLAATLRWVRRADADEDAVGRLAEALAERRRFARVDDWMYREVNPGEALIRLGFRCNQNCWFCWQGRDWPEPPAGWYERWLEEIAPLGYEKVGFTGGEPTLHRALPDLIARARDLGMKPWIQTNAVLLSKPKVLRRLVDAGLWALFVSYHSPDPETSDAMTRARGTHGRTVEGVRAALAAGLDVTINCVVERANFRQLPDHAEDVLAQFARPFPDAPPLRVVYSHPAPYFDAEDYRRGVVPWREVGPFLAGAVERLLSEGLAVDCFSQCGFPLCTLRDRPGLVERLLAHQPVEDASDAAQGRVFADACGSCDLRSRCPGLRRDYVEATGDWTVRPFGH
ncbi:MAG: radical SAM protein [Myxococcota bacterium]